VRTSQHDPEPSRCRGSPDVPAKTHCRRGDLLDSFLVCRPHGHRRRAFGDLVSVRASVTSGRATLERAIHTRGASSLVICIYLPDRRCCTALGRRSRLSRARASSVGDRLLYLSTRTAFPSRRHFSRARRSPSWTDSFSRPIGPVNSSAPYLAPVDTREPLSRYLPLCWTAPVILGSSATPVMGAQHPGAPYPALHRRDSQTRPDRRRHDISPSGEPALARSSTTMATRLASRFADVQTTALTPGALT